jgi:trehalose 6-phosphate synthase/phosphatase
VHVVSGRRREPLERWLGELSIGLHAEHGYWSRMTRDEPWVPMPGVAVEWKPDVRRMLEAEATRTPGALVEEKTVTLAWHWRMAEPELGAERADELWRRLGRTLDGAPVDLLRGEKVIEVRPRGVTKARVVERVLSAIGLPAPAVAAMGDDRTDEDTFGALPPEAETIAVGYRPSVARYRVATPSAARALLARILEAP